MKPILTMLLIASAVLSLKPVAAHSRPLSAQEVDSCQAGSQMLAYPVPTYGMPEATPAPEGYAPFHMEHYGRHGSRWLHHKDFYALPIKPLLKARKKGKLTARGEQLLDQLLALQKQADNRIGELTPLGHRQHREIAQRMVARYPELFAPGTRLDAKSTKVIRCILSMANEVAEIEASCPGIATTMDASQSTQRLLAANSSDKVATRMIQKAHAIDRAFASRHSRCDGFVRKVFADTAWAYRKLNVQELAGEVFDIAVNLQSHEPGTAPDLYDLFTPEELYEKWLCDNAFWYIEAGNTSLTNGRIPYKQRPLLRNIIESADTAVASPRQSVNLRFGHESIVLPLAVLMELDNCAYDTTDLETLADNWRNYEIFPMASNIQLIFYRPVGAGATDDVLVKVLLNEREAALPIEPAQGPYYRWADARQLWAGKLDAFSIRFPE